jgi:dihydrofolate reductase
MNDEKTTNQALISIIVARAENGVIGCDNKLPWRLANDLKYFKKVTMGKPVIMGRKTFDSIGKPLPGRLNIVVTRNLNWSATGVSAAHSLDKAITMAAAENTEIMVIGGACLYQQALEKADKIYLTLVKARVAGDVLFPELADDWYVVEKMSHPADDYNSFSHDILVFHRKKL